MALTIKQFPQRDAGTGEHSHADASTFEADDVTNKPEKADDLPAEVTYTADDVDNKPAKGGVDAEPTTHTTDWPQPEKPKAAENKAVTEADTKTRSTRKRS
jgi:hypothetical protein